LLFSSIPNFHFIKVFCPYIFITINPNLVLAPTSCAYSANWANPTCKNRIRIALQAFYDHMHLQKKNNKNVLLNQEEKPLKKYINE
jgi:hypothetical protein